MLISLLALVAHVPPSRVSGVGGPCARWTRRALLTSAVGVASPAWAFKIEYRKSPANAIEYAELKAGTGAKPRVGQQVVVDYMMTRRGGAKIHSTADDQQPFSWTLGDGSVIQGLEDAVLGVDDIPPLLVGGVRRIIVRQERGYGTKLRTWETSLRQLGPVPPEFIWVDSRGDRVNSNARFQNIYQNPNRVDQPDLLLDVKLLRVGSDATSTPVASSSPSGSAADYAAPSEAAGGGGSE